MLHLGGSGGMRCKAREGVIASYGDDEQRRSAPARAEPNVTVIFERLLSINERWRAPTVRPAVAFFLPIAHLLFGIATATRSPPLTRLPPLDSTLLAYWHCIVRADRQTDRHV